MPEIKGKIKSFVVGVLITTGLFYFGYNMAREYVLQQYYGVQKPCAVALQQTKSGYIQFLDCGGELFPIDDKSFGSIEQRVNLVLGENSRGLVPYKNELAKKSIDIPGEFSGNIDDTFMAYATERKRQNPIRYKTDLLEDARTAGTYFPAETAEVLPPIAKREAGIDHVRDMFK